MTGAVEASHMSSPVRVLQCDPSGTMPTLFISETSERPHTVRPPSVASRQPLPARLARLYVGSSVRTPERGRK